MLWRPSPSGDRLTVAVCDDCEEYDKDVIAHVAAHARLMFRNEVTVQDAVVAVTIMESSMQVRPCILHLAWTSAVDIVPVSILLSAPKLSLSASYCLQLELFLSASCCLQPELSLLASYSLQLEVSLSASYCLQPELSPSASYCLQSDLSLSASYCLQSELSLSASCSQNVRAEENTCCIKVGPTSGLPSAVVIFLAGQTPLFKSPEVECGTSLHGGYHCTGSYDSVYSVRKSLRVLPVPSHTILGDLQGLG